MSDLLNFSLPSQETVLTDIIKNNPYYIDIKGSVNICLIRCGQEIDDCRSINFDTMTNYGKILVLNPSPSSKSTCNIKLAFDSYNDNIDTDGSGNYKFEKVFFTVPSLHKLNGNLYDMETFIVFSSTQKNGNVLYICLCVLHNGVDNVATNDNKLLNFTLINNLFLNNTIPQKYGTSPIKSSLNPVDLNNFIPPPGSRNFYDYTHPHNNQVNFRVFQTVMGVSTSVLTGLKSNLFPGKQGVPLNSPTLTPSNDFINFKYALSELINPTDGLFFYFSEDMTNRYTSLKVNEPFNNTPGDKFNNMNDEKEKEKEKYMNKKDDEISNKKIEDKKKIFKKLNVEKDDFTIEENVESYESTSTNNTGSITGKENTIDQNPLVQTMDYTKTIIVILVIGFIYLSNLISYIYVFRFFQNSDNMKLSIPSIILSYFGKSSIMPQYESNSANKLNQEDEKYIEMKYPVDYTLGKILTIRLLSTGSIIMFSFLFILTVFLLVYNKFIGNYNVNSIFAGKVLSSLDTGTPDTINEITGEVIKGIPNDNVPDIFRLIQVLLVFILFIIIMFVYLIYRYFLLRLCRLHDDYYYKVENHFYDKVWKNLTFRRFIFFVFYNNYTSISSLPIIDYNLYKKDSIDLMEKYEKHLSGQIVPSTSDKNSMDKFALNSVFDGMRFNIYESLRPKKVDFNYSDTSDTKLKGRAKLIGRTIGESLLTPVASLATGAKEIINNDSGKRQNIIGKLKELYFEISKHCTHEIETYSTKAGIYFISALVLYTIIVILMYILFGLNNDVNVYGLGINFLISTMTCLGVYLPFILLLALFYLFFVQQIIGFYVLFPILVLMLVFYFMLTPFVATYSSTSVYQNFYFAISLIFYLVIMVIYVLYLGREKLMNKDTNELSRVHFRNIVPLSEKINNVYEKFKIILYDEDIAPFSASLSLLSQLLFNFPFLFCASGFITCIFGLIFLSPDGGARKGLYRTDKTPIKVNFVRAI